MGQSDRYKVSATWQNFNEVMPSKYAENINCYMKFDIPSNCTAKHYSLMIALQRMLWFFTMLINMFRDVCEVIGGYESPSLFCCDSADLQVFKEMF